MKTKVSLAATFLTIMLGCLLMSLPAHAQKERRMTRCCNNIPNLTEQQREQIRQMRLVHLIRMEELEMEKKQQKGWRQKGQVREKIDMLQEHHRKEIRNILNEDQRRYFDRRYAYVRGNDSKIHQREPNRALGKATPAGRGRSGKRIGKR